MIEEGLAGTSDRVLDCREKSADGRGLVPVCQGNDRPELVLRERIDGLQTDSMLPRNPHQVQVLGNPRSADSHGFGEHNSGTEFRPA